MRRPKVWTVYIWELRKLVRQKRTVDTTDIEIMRE